MKINFQKFTNSQTPTLISSWANIAYLTNYFGFSETERESFLLITKNKKYCITDKRYSQAVNEIAKGFVIIDIGVGKFLHGQTEIFKKLKYLAVEEDNLTVSEYKALKKFVRKITNLDTSSFRAIKQDSEVANIKKAAKIADEAFKFSLGKLRVGVSEKQIQSQIELFMKSKNADISFTPIVAFGKNSAIPHHVSGTTKLKKNSIVLIDLGAKVNGYCSDLSRTVYFGKADEKFKKIHQTVLEAQKRAISKIKTNVHASRIDKEARDYILSQKFPNIIHSVGHGVGIEVHEAPHLSPRSNDKLEKGMVFSVEPGIYLPNYGGVRIEDLVYLSSKGPQLISRSNRNIIEI